MIDQRAGAGITPASVPGLDPVPAVHGGAVLERSIVTCSHCQAGIIINPLRTRDRGYCPKCDHYICDSCEAERATTGICYTFKQRVDDALEQILKYGVNK